MTMENQTFQNKEDKTNTCETVTFGTNVKLITCNAIMTISGDGMKPLYSNGDMVLVSYCDTINEGEIGVFDCPESGRIVRYKGKTGLYSLNPDFERKPLSAESTVVIGKVLCKLTHDMILTLKDWQGYKKLIGNKKKTDLVINSD